MLRSKLAEQYCLDGMGGFLWGSPEDVAGPGLGPCLVSSVRGKSSHAGPDWVQDVPILPLGSCVTSQTACFGCQEGFPALPAG